MKENKYLADDVQIINGNFLSRQICIPKDMDIDLASRYLNEKDFCGTTLGWVFKEDLGEVQCKDDPTRKHLVYSC